MIKSLDQDFCCFLFTGLIVYARVAFSCYSYMYFVMCSSTLVPLHGPLFIDLFLQHYPVLLCVSRVVFSCLPYKFLFFFFTYIQGTRDISQVSLDSWFLCPLVEFLLACISLSQLNWIQYWNLNWKLMNCMTKDFKKWRKHVVVVNLEHKPKQMLWKTAASIRLSCQCWFHYVSLYL